MAQEGLYNDYARYYDLLYSFKNYETEAAEVTQFIEQYRRTDDDLLLDLGCGTGKHLQYLKQRYQCTGVDINAGILDVARQQNPDVDFVQQSMAELNLGKQFDAITSLFSAIGYLTTREELAAAIKAIADHLKTGGVVVIEPWLTKEVYSNGHLHMTTYDGPEVKIARMGLSSIKDDGNIAVMEMHYMVAEKGKDVINWVDINELMMVPLADIVALLEQHGVAAHIEKAKYTARGLIVGVKK